jgi:hypothetical protein
MVGIHADESDSGTTLEVPMGLPLELRLPAGAWEPVGSPAPLALQSLEAGDDATVGTWMAEGLGTAALHLVSGDRSFEATVTVTGPLMND